MNLGGPVGYTKRKSQQGRLTSEGQHCRSQVWIPLCLFLGPLDHVQGPESCPASRQWLPGLYQLLHVAYLTRTQVEDHQACTYRPLLAFSEHGVGVTHAPAGVAEPGV